LRGRIAVLRGDVLGSVGCVVVLRRRGGDMALSRARSGFRGGGHGLGGRAGGLVRVRGDASRGLLLECLSSMLILTSDSGSQLEERLELWYGMRKLRSTEVQTASYQCVLLLI
jgi:hypothetical protein